MPKQIPAISEAESRVMAELWRVSPQSSEDIAAALRKGIEIIYVEQNEELEKVGHIGALLRFRSDQNTPMKQAG